MQLTQFTDYSLRILLYLAERPGQRCTVGEIADWFRVSKQHLVKASHNLRKLGYLHSVQGKGGGISLAMAPEEINVGKLVRQIEPSTDLLECFDPETNTCRISTSCVLKHKLNQALRAFLEVLDGQQLSDLLPARTTKS